MGDTEILKKAGEASRVVAHQAALWAPVILRTVLYFLIGTLPTIIERFTKLDEAKATWPSVWWWTATWCVFFYNGLVPVRAYLDGSYQRHAQRVEHQKNGVDAKAGKEEKGP